MIVVNEIHDFEEIPPQVQYFVVFGSTKDGRQIAGRPFCLPGALGPCFAPGSRKNRPPGAESGRFAPGNL